MVTVYLEGARSAVKSAVERMGEDFVYNPAGGQCYYLPMANVSAEDPRGKTGCIVGTALTSLGETRLAVAVGTVGDVSQQFPGLMSRAAEEYFSIAQYKQDCGVPWGEALREAEEALPWIRRQYGDE